MLRPECPPLDTTSVHRLPDPVGPGKLDCLRHDHTVSCVNGARSHRHQPGTRPAALSPLLWVCWVVVLLLGLAATAVQTPVAAADEENDTLVFEEYVVPATIELPEGTPETAKVVLTDTLTGLDVPLAGIGISSTGGRTVAHIPQLPPGEFLLSWPGGSRNIEVESPGSGTAYIAEPGTNDRGTATVILLLGASAAVVVGLLLRRRGRLVTIAAVIAIGGGATLAAFALSGGSGGAARDWETCNFEQDANQQLLCKSSYLVGEFENGRYADVAALMSTNRDPMCHDVAHRTSFHIWRTTRDADLAAKLLIPGCDDGLIHGVAESIATFTADRDLADELIAFCTSAKEQFQIRACLHGGGHATIWRTNGDLEQAWEICREIPRDLVDSYDASEECMGSAVMEWADRWSTQKRQGKRLVRPDLDEPMALCLDGPDTHTFRQGCYLGTNHRTGDAAHAANWCLERETQTAACFSAVGENLPYFETPQTAIKLTPDRALHHAQACGLAPDDVAKEECARAMSRVFTIMNVSKTLGMEVCDAIRDDLRPGCLAGIKEAELKYEQRGLTLP